MLQIFKQCRTHDKITLKPALLLHDKNILSRDTSFMSRKSDIVFWLLYILELQHMHFQFDYLCSVTTYDKIVLMLLSGIL